MGKALRRRWGMTKQTEGVQARFGTGTAVGVSVRRDAAFRVPSLHGCGNIEVPVLLSDQLDQMEEACVEERRR